MWKSLLLLSVGILFTSPSYSASHKLGQGNDVFWGTPNPGPDCHGRDCHKKPDGYCTSNTDCPNNQYCKRNQCINVCRENSVVNPSPNKNEKNCAKAFDKKLKYSGGYAENVSSYPFCLVNEDPRYAHTSYCGCSESTCAQAYKCGQEFYKNDKCVPCPAGEKCGCPNNLVSNGKGDCVECIPNVKECDGDKICQGDGSVGSVCVEPKEDDGCITQCGQGFFYDRPGAKTGKNGKQEKVCTKYPQPCGYKCTDGWNIRYLVNNTEYTCQEASQCGGGSYNVNASANPNPKYEGCLSDKDLKDAECISKCGSGFKYDRMGAKNNGQEIVCTKYPVSCGWNCTTGWNITYLVNGSNYTCQQAYQCDRPGSIPKVKFLGDNYSYTSMKSSNYSSSNINHNDCKAAKKELEDQACAESCGDGYFFSSMGYKNNGEEKVCTKYPQDCGYACTSGWDINYLVDGTHTCQKAIQCTKEKTAAYTYVPASSNPNPNFSGCVADKTDTQWCQELCGHEGFYYDRPGAKTGKNGKQEKVCTRYPYECGGNPYSCTVGWNIEYLVKDTEYTCQTAVQCDEGATYTVSASANTNPDFSNCPITDLGDNDDTDLEREYKQLEKEGCVDIKKQTVNGTVTLRCARY